MLVSQKLPVKVIGNRVRVSTYLSPENSFRGFRKNGEELGEHGVDPEKVVSYLPAESQTAARVLFEVWAYNDEYEAPASEADIATELASRGKDPEFQEQLEEYAHSGDEFELSDYLDSFVRNGQLIRTEHGGYVTSSDYKPPIAEMNAYQKRLSRLIQKAKSEWISKPMGPYADWQECKDAGKTDRYCGYLYHHASGGAHKSRFNLVLVPEFGIKPANKLTQEDRERFMNKELLKRFAERLAKAEVPGAKVSVKPPLSEQPTQQPPAKPQEPPVADNGPFQPKPEPATDAVFGQTKPSAEDAAGKPHGKTSSDNEAGQTGYPVIGLPFNDKAEVDFHYKPPGVNDPKLIANGPPKPPPSMPGGAAGKATQPAGAGTATNPPTGQYPPNPNLARAGPGPGDSVGPKQQVGGPPSQTYGTPPPPAQKPPKKEDVPQPEKAQAQAGQDLKITGKPAEPVEGKEIPETHEAMHTENLDAIRNLARKLVELTGAQTVKPPMQNPGTPQVPSPGQSTVQNQKPVTETQPAPAVPAQQPPKDSMSMNNEQGTGATGQNVPIANAPMAQQPQVGQSVSQPGAVQTPVGTMNDPAQAAAQQPQVGVGADMIMPTPMHQDLIDQKLGQRGFILKQPLVEGARSYQHAMSGDWAEAKAGQDGTVTLTFYDKTGAPKQNSINSFSALDGHLMVEYASPQEAQMGAMKAFARLLTKRAIHGPGIPHDKFHSCVEQVEAAGTAENPYAVCMASLQEENFEEIGKCAKCSSIVKSFIVKHKLVGGKWVPTPGEEGGTGETRIQQAVQSGLKDVSRHLTSEYGKGEARAFQFAMDNDESFHENVMNYLVESGGKVSRKDAKEISLAIPDWVYENEPEAKALRSFAHLVSKHKLVGGKWVPTSGESGEEPSPRERATRGLSDSHLSTLDSMMNQRQAGHMAAGPGSEEHFAELERMGLIQRTKNQPYETMISYRVTQGGLDSLNELKPRPADWGPRPKISK